MKLSLLRIFFESLLLFFAGVFVFVLCLSRLLGLREYSLFGLPFAALWWATVSSPILAIIYTLIYRAYKKGK